VFSHGFNIAVAFAVVFTAVFVIPRFTSIFHDMLGSEPLPALTDLVLRLQPLWILLAGVFILLALYLAWRHRFNPPPTFASIVLFFLSAAQSGLILFALFLPLAGTIIRERPALP